MPPTFRHPEKQWRLFPGGIREVMDPLSSCVACTVSEGAPELSVQQALARIGPEAEPFRTIESYRPAVLAPGIR